MKKCTNYLLMVLILFVMNSSIHAEYFSPEGYWKTFDDDTHELESIVKLWIEKDKLMGRIVKLFPKPDALCSRRECTGLDGWTDCTDLQVGAALRPKPICTGSKLTFNSTSCSACERIGGGVTRVARLFPYPRSGHCDCS